MEVHASMTTQLQAAAETQQLVTVTQSIEIVQTLLHGSVSSILFVRDLLPPEAFVDQYYAAINSHRRYSDYVSGMHDPAALAESVGHHFKSLKKGKSTRGDRIINLLVSDILTFRGHAAYTTVGGRSLQSFTWRLFRSIAPLYNRRPKSAP